MNVPNMDRWNRDSLTLEMRLAFIDNSDPEYPIYDVLKFIYQWDTK